MNNKYALITIFITGLCLGIALCIAITNEAHNARQARDRCLQFAFGVPHPDWSPEEIYESCMWILNKKK